MPKQDNCPMGDCTGGDCTRYVCCRQQKASSRSQAGSTAEFEREDRYVVLKRKDIAQYLSEAERNRLEEICIAVDSERDNAGKPPIRCVVVEHDWPEYEPTWAAIEARVKAGQ